MLRFDGDAECGAQPRGVLIHHEWDLELIEAGACHRHADKTTAVLRHEVDRLRRDFLRGQREVSLVLAVFVVADDDDFAGAKGVDGVFDARERTGLPAALRDLQWSRHTFCPMNSIARSTYLPIMSHSRFTRFPARNARRLVCDHVNGTICTSRVVFSSVAIVRLMPSTATDPRWMRYGASDAG